MRGNIPRKNRIYKEGKKKALEVSPHPVLGQQTGPAQYFGRGF